MVKTVRCSWCGVDQLLPGSETSIAMSKVLRGHGFRFVGPSTCYAFMQSVGMVNDHLVECRRCSTCSEQGKPWVA